jgi:multicomponent Na+:H+ antiporter subunit B
MLVVVAVAIAWQRNLFSVVILSGIYSFILASVFVVLDAMDVALTEAAVGAGVSIVFLLTALHLVRGTESPPFHRQFLPLFVVLITAGALSWAAMVLPPFGAPDAPMHVHVAPRYLQEGVKETGVPNIVTAVLADYRSFDTLGEVTVIFTAGIGALLLLSGMRRRRRAPDRTETGQ